MNNYLLVIILIGVEDLVKKKKQFEV